MCSFRKQILRNASRSQKGTEMKQFYSSGVLCQNCLSGDTPGKRDGITIIRNLSILADLELWSILAVEVKITTHACSRCFDIGSSLLQSERKSIHQLRKFAGCLHAGG